MRIQGDLQLSESSKIFNAILPSGNTFPEVASNGELWIHTGQADPIIEAGLYYYRLDTWELMVSLTKLTTYNQQTGASVKITNAANQRTKNS